MSRKTLLALLRIGLALAMLVVNISPALAAVWTDQADYSPGDIVTIHGDNSDGAGYQAGETVHVDVTGPNGYVAACDGAADAGGAWSCQVTLWPDYLAVGAYDFVAAGQTSGVRQNGAFTDGNLKFHETGLPGGTSWTVTWNNEMQTKSAPNDLTFGGGLQEAAYTVSSPLAGATGVQYVGSPASGIATRPGSGNTTVNVSFATQYQITFAISPLGGGTTDPIAGTAWYDEGSVPVSAAPSAGYAFSSWSADTSSIAFADASLASTTATVSGPGTITANFTVVCTAPMVTSDPIDQSITYGSDASFTVIGTDYTSVQWQVSTDNGTTWSNISGTDSPDYALTTPPVSLSGNQYRAVLTGDCGSPATSGAAILTVDPAGLTITANEASKTYGDLVTFGGTEFTTSALVPGDSVTRVTLASDGAAADAPVSGSPYAIVASAAVGTGLDNYTINYVNGSLTIDKKAASVTPNAASKTYGDADPTLTGTLTGFLAADNITAAYSRVAGETVLGGPYTISAVLSPDTVLGNYDITYNTANFTIDKKAASVTPNAASKTYGDADPTLTGTLTGFLAADNVTAAYSRVAGETVAGSPYNISATLSPADVLANYDITYNTADFTIDKAALTVTADNKAKLLNAPNPDFTFKYAGFVHGETEAALTTKPTCGSTAVTNSPVGIYPITCSGGVAANYLFTYEPGTLTVSYSTADCYGGPGHAILQPINSDGTSVFKQKSTVPAKFRVCDANGISIGTPGVVASFKLVQILSGTSTTVVTEDVESTTPDTAFRWSASDQQWMFNMNTKNSRANQTYVYLITLNDSSTIQFQFGLK